MLNNTVAVNMEVTIWDSQTFIQRIKVSVLEWVLLGADAASAIRRRL